MSKRTKSLPRATLREQSNMTTRDRNIARTLIELADLVIVIFRKFGKLNIKTIWTSFWYLICWMTNCFWWFQSRAFFGGRYWMDYYSSDEQHGLLSTIITTTTISTENTIVGTNIAWNLQIKCKTSNFLFFYKKKAFKNERTWTSCNNKSSQLLCYGLLGLDRPECLLKFNKYFKNP